MAGPNAGRRGGRWLKLKAEVRARQAKCCRCGMTIDYSLVWPDPDSFSVDHYPYPRTTHPHLAEDPGNLAASHLRCNQHASDAGSMLSLGSTSADW